MRIKQLIAVTAILTAGAAFAHDGVKNPAVKKRMIGMSSIAANTKIIGSMAKGAIAFDADAANAALAAIEAEAAKIPAKFKAQETDPKSEAKPSIWSNFGDFTAKATMLEAAAKSGAGIATKADLGPALQGLGQSCKSCHGAYRE